MKKFSAKHLLISFLMGAVFFSSVSFAASNLSKIEVSFAPIQYYFDGMQKFPQAGQQGFLYKGTTYVPLRFVSQSLGKEVNFDGKTQSIYVGEMPDGTATFIDQLKPINSDNNLKPIKALETTTGVKSLHGYQIKNDPWFPSASKYYVNEYVLNKEYKKFQAFIAPDLFWKGKKVNEHIGDIKLFVDDHLMFSSDAIRSDQKEPIKIEVSLTGDEKLRVEARGYYLDLIDPKLVK